MGKRLAAGLAGGGIGSNQAKDHINIPSKERDREAQTDRFCPKGHILLSCRCFQNTY